MVRTVPWTILSLHLVSAGKDGLEDSVLEICPRVAVSFPELVIVWGITILICKYCLLVGIDFLVDGQDGVFSPGFRAYIIRFHILLPYANS